MHVLLSQFMRHWHGKIICEWLAIVLFGVELVENYFALIGELNVWNFRLLFKMFLFTVGIHSGHSVFQKMAIWSNCSWPTTNKKNSRECSVHRWWEKVTTTPEDSWSFYKITQKLLFTQLPLPVLVILAVFHSVSGAYFFYQLTGFVRQNYIHKEEDQLYKAFIYCVDVISILTVLLWFRWTLVFYSHEANEMQNKIKLWWKIFDRRWQYIAWCTIGLSSVLLALAFLKLFIRVPYLKIEMIPTTVTSLTWLFHIAMVTVITFLSCFPHGVSQILALVLTFTGFHYTVTGEAEMTSEAYGILYFLVPSAMAVAAMGYHTCFSPTSKKGVEWGKIVSVVIAALLVFMMAAVVRNEMRAFNITPFIHSSN